MKKRVLMLLVGLFAVVPALLGSSWASENRKNSEIATEGRSECDLRTAAAKKRSKTVAKSDISAEEKELGRNVK